MKPEAFEQVPISKVLVRKNIRTVFDDEALSELAESIKQRGVLHPITCRKSNGELELIAGERRLRAAKKAGLTEIPALVKEADDTEVAYDRIVENLQREGLTDDDKYNALKSMSDKGLSVGKISKMTGISTTTIQRILVLESLKPSIRERSDISAYGKSFIARAPEYVQDILAERVAQGAITSKTIGHDVMPAINKVRDDGSFSQEEKNGVIQKIAREAATDRPARTIFWQERGKKKMEGSGLDAKLASSHALKDLLDSSYGFHDKLLALKETEFDHLEPQLVIGVVAAFRDIHHVLADILEGIESAKKHM